MAVALRYFVLLMALDAVTTGLLSEYASCESNPLAYGAVTSGLVPLVLYKAALTGLGLLVVFAYRARGRCPGLITWALHLINAAMAIVVGLNAYQLV